MKSNVISPIQKIQIFQYNNKTNYEKLIYWVNYYIQWIGCWLILFYHKFGKYMEENIGKGFENWVSKHSWIKSGLGYIGYRIYMDKKKMRLKTSNTMLNFIEIEYEKWEEKVQQYLGNRGIIGEGKWGNENMEVEYYDKEAFGKIYQEIIMELSSSNMESKEEKKWKRRVMIVHVPMIGNVMMYYDIFRMSFAYYSDTKGIHYNILNACAMRYVGMFRCMDLFMDEMVGLRGSESSSGGEDGGVGKYWKSPIRWVNKVVEEFELKPETDLTSEKEGGHRGIYERNGGGVGGSGKGSSGKGIQLDKAERDKLFAKLKQYRTEYVQENEIKLRNKFIYKGKINDSYYHVFSKKVREVKVVDSSKMDMKKAFYSGILPMKLPKFWEVEEPRPVFSGLKEKGVGVEEGRVRVKGGEEEKGEEESSYVKYKREMENKKALGKI
jgi:hypothetical protein